VSAFAQNERVNWHFGPSSAGLFFNLNNSTVNTVNNYYTPYAYAGSSVVSSSIDGSLLFYTDGIKIVDASHQVMPNGSGLLTGGNASEGTGLTVPFPNDCNKYYVFEITTATETNTIGNLYYSVVDMTLPGNGTITNPKGDVVSGSKNILLAQNVGEGSEFVYNPSGNNYWLLNPSWVQSSSNNTMQVYKINNSGVSLHSSYNIGVPMFDIQPIYYNALHNICFIASLKESDPCLLLDFDIVNGNFTNTNIIPGTPLGTSAILYSGVTDGEWSADWSKLYISKLRCTAPTYGAGHIYQYDLNNPSASPTIVFTPTNSSSYSEVCAGLRRGPDDKIYFSYKSTSNPNTYVGCINNPNNIGTACNVNPQQITFSTSLQSTFALFPKFVKRQDIQIKPLSDSTICAGQSITLNASGSLSNYQWSGGSSATTDSIIVTPDTTTNYYVTGTSANCGNSIDSVKIYVTDCSGNPSSTKPIGSLGYDFTNVFTPNNDGQNDYFTLNLVNAAAINLQIFNRWGNPMITITDINSKGWDGKTQNGKDASDGTYFFLYQIKGLDGQSVKDQGFLQLIRN
jgi:gliding motility-associated-like protein